MMPSLVLKKMIMANFPQEHQDQRIIDSVDFMVEKVSAFNLEADEILVWLNIFPIKVFYF